MTEPYPRYAEVGVRDGDGYRQLATTLLQIENEFYGTIRPKQRIRRGERPLRALGERGVEYVEVRCIDVNPFHPVGISADEMRLLDIFLLHCLLRESPPDSPREVAAVSCNQYLVAERGRDPDLRLDRAGAEIAPAEWGRRVLDECSPIAAALDGAGGSSSYGRVLAAAGEALSDFDALPSTRVLREAEHRYGKSFPGFALAQSVRHRRALLDLPLAADIGARFEQMAADSLVTQLEIEAADTVPFETYRRQYLAQDLMYGTHFRRAG